MKRFLPLYPLFILLLSCMPTPESIVKDILNKKQLIGKDGKPIQIINVGGVKSISIGKYCYYWFKYIAEYENSYKEDAAKDREHYRSNSEMVAFAKSMIELSSQAIDPKDSIYILMHEAENEMKAAIANERRHDSLASLYRNETIKCAIMLKGTDTSGFGGYVCSVYHKAPADAFNAIDTTTYLISKDNNVFYMGGD